MEIKQEDFFQKDSSILGKHKREDDILRCSGSLIKKETNSEMD